MAVPSPCINVCTLDHVTGLCQGCARTLQEIGDWTHLDDAGKQVVWNRIAERRSRAEDQASASVGGPHDGLGAHRLHDPAR